MAIRPCRFGARQGWTVLPPQELGGVAGDLSGGALLLAAAGAQPAGPLVKHRVAGAVVHLQVQGRLSAARKILDQADDLADVAVQGPQGPARLTGGPAGRTHVNAGPLLAPRTLTRWLQVAHASTH
jgi:hypothetical protein